MAPDNTPPYRWAAGAAGAVFLLYAATLAPTTAFWDTSEYIATGHMLGIPHPPGNPLFVVLARAWDILLAPLGLSTAVRINLLSAAVGAAAHGFWFLVVHHILRHFSRDRRFRLAGAGAAALVSATAFTVWNQSNVNEKVYTVSLLTIAVLTWLTFRWQENLGKGREDNLLVLMAFIMALSVGNHLMALLVLPSLFLFILAVRARALLNPRLYATSLAAVLLGLSIHLFLPIRSGLNPVINEAQPTCAGVSDALVSIATYGNAGCEELSSALKREQYAKPPLIPRQAPLFAQYGNWLQYFDWQWARGVSFADNRFPPGRLIFTMLFLALGAFGLREHYRRDRASWLYVASLFGILSVGLVYYLNFRHGYSFPSQGNPQEVRERDYFFIVGFSVWGLIAGIGIASLWKSLARRRGMSMRMASPVLLLALAPLVLNFQRASRTGDYSARDWAYNLLMSVEPYALIFTNGDNDTFPLWYLQEVEGIRRDVIVAVTSYLNTDWYVKQLRGLSRPCGPAEDPDADPTRILCQRPYTPAGTGAMYTDDPARAQAAGLVPLVVPGPVSPPTRSVVSSELTDGVIDRVVVTAIAPLPEDRRFALGPVTATVARGRQIQPWMQFVLSFIDTSIEDRPIYFASAVGAPEDLGLRRHIVRQGVAYRLWPGDPAPLQSAGIAQVGDPTQASGVGVWMDTDRTRTLVDEVYVHRSGLPDAWDHWRDPSSLGIPSYYALAYFALYREANLRGDSTTANRMLERTQAWSDLGL